MEKVIPEHTFLLHQRMTPTKFNF